VELRIRIPNGEISIPFSTAEDLEKSLGGLDVNKIVNAVVERFGAINAVEPKVRMGLEGVYEPGSDGLPVLLAFPPSKVEVVGLSVFVSEPRGLTGPELDRVSHVKDSVKNFVATTRYKELFERRDDRVHVSHEGARWVTETVIPKLSNRAVGGAP